MTGQRLDGVVAVVTGGNSGIGEATCRRLARDGAQVAIGYLDNEPRAAQLAAELSARGPACLAVYGNVRETASVQAMIEQLNQDCASSLAEWTSTAREAYQTYSGQWTTAANDLPVQAANAQNSLGEITSAYATAEYQGLGLWGQ